MRGCLRGRCASTLNNYYNKIHKKSLARARLQGNNVHEDRMRPHRLEVRVDTTTHLFGLASLLKSQQLCYDFNKEFRGQTSCY